jgi:succinyl-CoA synthetase beta subunit
MNVHEYQAKDLFRAYGVPVPPGEVAATSAQAEAATRRLAQPVAVIKAQIHAGGRGKGGGIKLAKTPAEARERAAEIIGMTLVTPQTGSEGKKVRKVYVEAASDIARELYLAITLDRDSGRFAIIASTAGGMDIEEVAARTPEKIRTVLVRPTVGLQGYQVRSIAYSLGLEGEQVKQFEPLLTGIYRLFIDKDAALVEVNPLVVTRSGQLLVLDAKVNFDDSALFRHPDIAALRDPEEEEPLERVAAEVGFSYVGLDGNIGCMVNGAGLAMATMDMISVCGGRPANFLDVGGDADKTRIENAFKLLLRDEKVKAILINIFGGIVRCDLIAEGVVAASKGLGIHVPLVVRLQGTNAPEGRRILAASGLGLISAETLREAAERAVAAAAAGLPPGTPATMSGASPAPAGRS